MGMTALSAIGRMIPGPAFFHPAAATLAAWALILGAAARAEPPVAGPPTLTRIRIATVGATDPARVAALYVKYFGYKLRQSGTVSRDMAISWGARRMRGHDYALVSPDSDPDAFIRIVAVDPVGHYAALTTSGWNGVEIIVDQIDRLYARLKGSPFVANGPPVSHSKSFPSIQSITVEGPAHETLYLTAETGDRSKSLLPSPGGQVGRPFVIWVTGPNILQLRDWYARAFSMTPLPSVEKPVTIPGAAAGATMPNTVLLMKERGNLVQFEGDPAQFRPRPHADGQLPEGNAMASFGVDNLDALPVKFIAPPKALYGGHRAATTIDPNGNLVELIEEKPE